MKWIFLDFGSHRIKALKADIEGQRIQVEDFAHLECRPEFFEGLDYPAHPAWAATSVGLNELNWLAEDNIAISAQLPSSYLETRYLQFPFSSEKKIEKVLPFEIEASLPFDVENVILKNRVLKGIGVETSKQSHVFVLAYKRDLISRFENELRGFQIQIPSISVDILTLTSLRHAVDTHPVIGLLHIGHRKTQLVFVQASGQILGLRTFWWGGEKMQQAMMKSMDLTPQRALEVFIQKASFEVSKDSAAIDIKLAEALESSLKTFMNEFRQVMKGFQQNGIQLPKPTPIYVLGRSSLTPGLIGRLSERFREEFQLEFTPYPIKKLSQSIKGLDTLKDPMSALGTLSQALAQIRPHRGRILNFSESSFQLQQNIKKIQGQSVTLIKQVAMLLIAPLAYLILSAVIQGQEAKKIRGDLQRQIEQANLNIDPTKSTDEVLMELKRLNRERLNRIEALKEDQKSPLLILSDLSKGVSENLRIDFKEFRVTDTKVLIAAETNSIETKDRILDAVKKVAPTVNSGAVKACSSYPGCQSFSMEFERP